MQYLNDGTLEITAYETPQFGSNLYLGDKITISFYYKPLISGLTQSVSVGLRTKNNAMVELGYYNVYVPIQTQVYVNITGYITDNVINQLKLDDDITDVTLYFAGFNKPGGAYGKPTVYHVIWNDSFESDIYHLHRNPIDLKIDATFVRFDGSKIDNEGNMALCTNLKATSDVDVNEIMARTTILNATANDESKSQDFIIGTFTQEMLREALTEKGYTESTPTIFPEAVFDLGVTYEINVSVIFGGSQSFNSAIATAYLERSFANMHFSPHPNGGVCFGGFSSSTEDEQKFESHYMGYFYQGFDVITVKMLGNVMYPIGSIYINVEDDYRYSPEYIFGGKWEQINDRFLLASSNAHTTGEAGGSITQSVPPHVHMAPIGTRQANTIAAITGQFGAVGAQTFSGYMAAWNTANAQTTVSDVAVPYTSDAISTGSSDSVLPPYIAVNIWKRIGLYGDEND